MSQAPVEEHILKQSWPKFLDHLRDDSTVALDEFADFAYRVLQYRTPRIVESLPREQHDDYIQEIIMHIINNDGEILRQYRNTGQPFASWFIVVASRKACDLYRRDKKQNAREASLDEQQQYGATPSSAALPDEKRSLDELDERVRACIRRLPLKCQVLLQAAREEYQPKEMAALLPGVIRDNKHASDTLRACRNRLLAMLKQEGIDPNDIFEMRPKENGDE